jgi:hypothetical protein
MVRWGTLELLKDMTQRCSLSTAYKWAPLSKGLWRWWRLVMRWLHHTNWMTRASLSLPRPIAFCGYTWYGRRRRGGGGRGHHDGLDRAYIHDLFKSVNNPGWPEGLDNLDENHRYSYYVIRQILYHPLTYLYSLCIINGPQMCWPIVHHVTAHVIQEPVMKTATSAILGAPLPSTGSLVSVWCGQPPLRCFGVCERKAITKT